jgi:ribose 5-phosphate isomerase B
MKEKILIASDHGGFELKEKISEYLKEKDFEVIDLGTNSTSSCDYPVFAKKLSKAILDNVAKQGILICGTGLGMQITANRFKGIRAVCVSDTFSAKMSKEHNNSNVLCLGARVLGTGLAKEIVNCWLNSTFQGERHQKRIDMIDEA